MPKKPELIKKIGARWVMQMAWAAHSKHILPYSACLSSNLLSLSWWLMTWNTKFSRSGSKTTSNPTEKTSSHVHSLSSGTARGRDRGFLGVCAVPSDPRSCSPDPGGSSSWGKEDQGASAVGLTWAKQSPAAHGTGWGFLWHLEMIISWEALLHISATKTGHGWQAG